jgi:hypothetical protein
MEILIEFKEVSSGGLQAIVSRKGMSEEACEKLLLELADDIRAKGAKGATQS